MFNQVRDFMDAAKVSFRDPHLFLRCAKLIAEESDEAIAELGFERLGNGSLGQRFGQPSVRKTAKECIDVIYVAVYTLYALGLSDETIKQAWDLVCKNNLAKFGEGHSFREGDGKLLPPPGFVKENLSSLIP